MGALEKERKLYDQYVKKEREFQSDSIKGILQFHQEFQTANEIFEYGIRLFEEQKAQCAISGILMDNRENADSCFQPSLDAINPRKHHVKGNLRWVCLFLNNANFDKVKVYHNPDDQETT